MAKATPPKDAIAVTINGTTVRPTDTYSADASNTRYIVVCTRDIPSPEQQQNLLEAGVTIRERVGDNVYLCEYGKPDLASIRSKPYIRQADVYQVAFKIARGLKTVLAKSPDTPLAVNVGFHPGVNISTVATELAKKVGIDQSKVFPSTVGAQITALPKAINDIAQDDRVRVVEEALAGELLNAFAKLTLWEEGFRPPENPSGPFLINKPLNQLPKTGRGEIITVTDTGFDRGKILGCHYALQGKVVALYNCTEGAPNQGPFTDDSQIGDLELQDVNGHGTHVCGSAIWAATLPVVETRPQPSLKPIIPGVGPPVNPADFGTLTTLDTQLIVQKSASVAKASTFRPAPPRGDFTTVFLRPYNDFGSRIFSNSWADSFVDEPRRGYSDETSSIDNFVRTRQDAVILWAAGNANQSEAANSLRGGNEAKEVPTVTSWPAARNILTVGACGTLRTGSRYTPSQMAPMSSWGPTQEGLIKPDVVAPGYEILSAATTNSFAQRNAGRTGAGGATTSPWDNPFWCIKSGTSMATPLAAGSVSIIRQAARENPGLNNIEIPAALIKAAVINGAQEIPGVPRNAQGFGVIHVQNSLDMLSAQFPRKDGQNIGFEITLPLAQTEERTVGVRIPKPPLGFYHVFKVTMAYTDKPGARRQDNINLQLTVKTEDNKPLWRMLGNQPGFLGPDDKMDGKRDDVNNVEQIVIDLGPKTPFPGADRAALIGIKVVATEIVPFAASSAASSSSAPARERKTSCALAWQFVKVPVPKADFAIGSSRTTVP